MVVVGPVLLGCDTNGTRSRGVSLANGCIKRRGRSQGHAYRTDNVFGNYEYERRELHQIRPIFGTWPSTSLFEAFRSMPSTDPVVGFRFAKPFDVCSDGHGWTISVGGGQ